MRKKIITAADVENYLQIHPEFFAEHLHLLEKLDIPQPSGGAVSLIAKQLEIFKKRYSDLENQLTELIEIARDNDATFDRMHRLTLALLDAQTVEQVLKNLDIVLSECFLTDFVTLRIIDENAPASVGGIFLKPSSKDLKPFHQDFLTREPRCGKLTAPQGKVLFGGFAKEVKSCAVIPLIFTELEGLLVIGSRDENRFHASMGHFFLTQIGELVATRLITLLDNQAGK